MTNRGSSRLPHLPCVPVCRFWRRATTYRKPTIVFYLPGTLVQGPIETGSFESTVDGRREHCERCEVCQHTDRTRATRHLRKLLGIPVRCAPGPASMLSICFGMVEELDVLFFFRVQKLSFLWPRRRTKASFDDPKSAKTNTAHKQTVNVCTQPDIIHGPKIPFRINIVV